MTDLLYARHNANVVVVDDDDFFFVFGFVFRLSLFNLHSGKYYCFHQFPGWEAVEQRN